MIKSFDELLNNTKTRLHGLNLAIGDMASRCETKIDDTENVTVVNAYAQTQNEKHETTKDEIEQGQI